MKITIIMPVYNGETTVIKALESLLGQSIKFYELIVVDDNSTDGSKKIIQAYLADKGEYSLVEHQQNLGLAKAYNEGVNIAKGDLIVTMHQDVILQKDSLEKLIAPFGKSEVVAASHVVTHPLEIWETYNFWQKFFFARLAGKDFSGIDGKFDCFRREALMKIGLFDEVHFHSAGEDGDVVFRLKKIGQVVDTHAKIIHLHKIDPNFSYGAIIEKQKQYSEAQGVLLRLGSTRSIGQICKAFFREILVVMLFVPSVTILSIGIIFVYSFVYSKIMFLREWRDKRIFVLPMLNVYLLFVSFFYSVRGFIYKKQQM